MRTINWDRELRFCEWCGKSFMPKSPNHTYCSAKCRKKGAEKKQQERLNGPFSPNMRKIMEMVKDDPNYGRMQVEEEYGKTN